jgi:hypothetical protein
MYGATLCLPGREDSPVSDDHAFQPGAVGRLKRRLRFIRLRQAARQAYDLMHLGSGAGERFCAALVLGGAFFLVFLIVAIACRLGPAQTFAPAALALAAVLIPSAVLILGPNDDDLEAQRHKVARQLAAARQAQAARAAEEEVEEVLPAEPPSRAVYPVARRRHPAAATKRCPFCAEVILSQAVKCKHCGEFLDEYLDDGPTPDGTPAHRTRNTGALPTDLAGGEGREYPEVPGYEILGILGHGGMGVVYRARQLKANRLVALKMIRAVEHASPTDRPRFQIETEAVARLQHPHIVQLYEAGEVRGQPFVSLEFCDGGTLTQQWKKKPPTPREAAGLIETLARAMLRPDLRGVAHRDLKPGNVL